MLFLFILMHNICKSTCFFRLSTIVLSLDKRYHFESNITPNLLPQAKMKMSVVSYVKEMSDVKAGQRSIFVSPLPDKLEFLPLLQTHEGRSANDKQFKASCWDSYGSLTFYYFL